MTSPSDKPAKTDGRDWQKLRDRLARATSALEEGDRLSAERASTILEKRAQVLAQVPPAAPGAGEVVEALVFSLGVEHYALATDHLRGVIRLGDITAVPGTPDFLMGVTNLRGVILALFDLRRFFGLPAVPPTDTSRIIVLGNDRPEFGILADAVLEVTRLRNDHILPAADAITGTARDFVRGVTREALIVLDGAVLLKESRLFIE